MAALTAASPQAKALVASRQARAMRRGALRVTEQHRAGLGVEPALDDFFKLLRRPRQHRVAERIEPGLVGAHFMARGVLDAFADDHNAVFVGLHRLFHFGQKLVLFKWEFRQQDDMGRVRRVAPLGQNRAGRDPARRTAHHLDDAAGTVVGGHAPHVQADSP